MKILLTGATGFLGKHLLRLLLDSTEVSHVYAVSRSKKSHPHEKVTIIPADLSDPASINILPPDADIVVHLSGLYDFTSSFYENYQQNVLPALNLVSYLLCLNKSRQVPIFHASTYTVRFGTETIPAEEPLSKLPPKSMAYAHTKAIAEKAFTDSKLPYAIFRLGVLVGTSHNGKIEKLDGPYAFLKILDSMASLPKALQYLPIPADKTGILPLVPIDCAASVLSSAISRLKPASGKPLIFGVYNAKSVRLGDFCDEMISHFSPHTKAAYFKKTPILLLRFQERITHIPAETFLFASDTLPLENPNFRSMFKNNAIPAFKTYKKAFLDGFHEFINGGGSQC
ncbi:MAG: SDR family oxidoreductase [Bdellovibrionota bacterium]